MTGPATGDSSAHRTRTYTPRLQRPGCCHYTRADHAKALSLRHENQFCHTALPPGVAVVRGARLRLSARTIWGMMEL